MRGERDLLSLVQSHFRSVVVHKCILLEESSEEFEFAECIDLGFSNFDFSLDLVT